MSPKIALFPGSFDPVTKGHEALVHRGLDFFDEIIVAVGQNANKSYLFSLEQRLAWLNKVFARQKRVKTTHYEGLTIHFCKKIGANFILRGLRNTTDFEYEKSIAQMHYGMKEKIDTIFLMTQSELSAINSSIVRDLIRNGGTVADYIPDAIRIQLT